MVWSGMLRYGRFVRCALPAVVAGENSGHHNPSRYGGDFERQDSHAFRRITGGEGIHGWQARNWDWDPRPDLVSDHRLWEVLLTQIVDDEAAGWVLNASRCDGATLRWDNGMYHIVPIIDPRLGFDSEEDWREFREKWLMPMKQQIVSYLKKLAVQMEGEKAS